MIKKIMVYVMMCSASANGMAQRSDVHAPQPGTYSSTMMTSWLTVTPLTDANPSKSRYKTVDYGVGSLSIQGLFGDLVLHKDGTYTLTKDTHGGTWDYNAEKDSIILTGWLSTFKTGYFRDDHHIIIYTGNVKMPDGGTLNIRYYKQTE